LPVPDAPIIPVQHVMGSSQDDDAFTRRAVPIKLEPCQAPALQHALA